MARLAPFTPSAAAAAWTSRETESTRASRRRRIWRNIDLRVSLRDKNLSEYRPLQIAGAESVGKSTCATIPRQNLSENRPVQIAGTESVGISTCAMLSVSQVDIPTDFPLSRLPDDSAIAQVGRGTLRAAASNTVHGATRSAAASAAIRGILIRINNRRVRARHRGTAPGHGVRAALKHSTRALGLRRTDRARHSKGAFHEFY